MKKKLDYFMLIFWLSLIFLISSIFFVSFSGFLLILGGILLLISLIFSILPKVDFNIIQEIKKFLIFYINLIKNFKKIFNKKQIKKFIKNLLNKLKKFPKGFIKYISNITNFYKNILKNILKKPKKIFKISIIIIAAIFGILILYNLIVYVIRSGVSVIGLSFLVIIIIFLIFMTIITIKYNKSRSLKQIKESRKTIIHKIIFIIFIIFITLILIIFKRGLLDRKFTLYFIIIGSVITAILMILFTRFYNVYKPKILKKKKRFKLISIEFKRGKYTTDIDLLYQLIKTNDCVPLSYAAKHIKVDKKIIEEWAKILEKHDLIIIDYPAWGEPELCKK